MENIEKNIDKKLTIREKLGIYVLLMILNIVGPWENNWSAQAPIKELKDLIQGKVTE